ncbi:MAG: PD-(D/E)XK nuclease family transposase [Pirellulaceae bacterium]|nr:PD-(D/E)XK nuclease family transposase [Pirellulaceae bacterium]
MLRRAQFHELPSCWEYRQLKPVIIIALVEDLVWAETRQPHHRFELTDRESGRVLSDTLSIHIVELEKYNLEVAALPEASPLERWVFWLRHAQEYDVQELRELFPGNEFDVVNSLLLEISQQTKDKSMYDAQEKQRRDLLWLQNIAIEEAEERGEARGEARGELKEKIRTLQEILGLSVSTDSEIKNQTLEELQAQLADLQVRVKSRG